MIVQTTLVTLDGTAQAFPAAPTAGVGVTKLLVEPLRTNANIVSVGLSTVTNDASGTGVIQEISQPGAATVTLDRFLLEDMTGMNGIDPTKFYVRGTNTQKCKITMYQA